MEITRRIDLPGTRADAWAALVDWERQADWMRDADRVEVVSEHREGVGVRLEVRTRLLGIPAFTEPMAVTAWDPPARLTIAHGGPVAGEGEWRLDVVRGGVVTFTWTERVRLRTPVLGAVAAWCYRPVMGVLMRRAQRGLRDELARRTSAPS